MQITKHAYGQVFDSLLEGLKGDVVLTKTAAKKADPVLTGMDVFSATTESAMKGIQEDEFNAIINELQFAADNAKIALNEEDVSNFVARAYKDNMRGKTLEREASRYCNQINREVATPESATKLNAELLFDLVTHHKVVNASYNPESMSETQASGRYMGCVRNPNSIWDTEALQRYAVEKHGDERIKEAQVKKEEMVKTAKQEMWNEMQEKLTDPNMVNKGITKAADTTAAEPAGNQKLAANAMSMFSEERDFQNIPEKSVGDMIKEAAEKRSGKSKTAEAKAEWNKVEPAKKTTDKLDTLFDAEK